METKVRRAPSQGVGVLGGRAITEAVSGFSIAVLQVVALAWLGLLGDRQVSDPRSERRAGS
jgi:hypothetical protein